MDWTTLLLLIGAVLLYSPLLLRRREDFALHDKPASWTHHLIRSRDPTAEEMWRLSQSYLDDAWTCGSRIHTVPDGRSYVTRGADGCCCLMESGCR